MTHENSAGQRSGEDFPNPDGAYANVARLYGAESNIGLNGLVFTVSQDPGRIINGYENLSRVRQEENRLAYTDPLTELPNRRAWNEALILMEQGHYGENPAVVVIDLDNFKRVNDSAGHDVGDEALVKAATVLGGIVREGDHIFFRTGGDEFMGIFRQSPPDSHPEGKRGKTPRSSEDRRVAIRERLDAGFQPFRDEYAEYGLGASVGVAIRESDMPVQEAVKAADDDLGLIKKEHKKAEFFSLPLHKRWLTRAGHFMLKEAGTRMDPRVYGHSFSRRRGA